MKSGSVLDSSDLLLVGQLLVLLRQYLGQVQVAHLWVDFGVFGSFLHEEAKVRSQRFLREIWVSLWEQVRGAVWYQFISQFRNHLLPLCVFTVPVNTVIIPTHTLSRAWFS